MSWGTFMDAHNLTFLNNCEPNCPDPQKLTRIIQEQNFYRHIIDLYTKFSKSEYHYLKFQRLTPLIVNC
jgi:hypothetical protein